MIYQNIIETFEKCNAPLQSVDGELFYKKTAAIPEHCIDLAKEYKTRIIAILDGQDLSRQWRRDNLFIQTLFFYRNLSDPSNDKIERWLNTDAQAAKLFMEITTEYEACGWQDISEAPFNFENETTKRLMESFYQNAVAFFKKERVTS